MFNTNPAIYTAKQLQPIVAEYENASFADLAAKAKELERSMEAKEKSEEADKKAYKYEKKLRKEAKKADKAAAKAAAKVCKQAKKGEGAVVGSIAPITSIGHFEKLASIASAPPPAQEVEQIRFNGFQVGTAAETEVIVTSTDENGKVEVLSHTIESNNTGDTVDVAAKAAEVATANPEVANSALGNALLNPKRAQSKPQVQVRQPSGQRVAPKKG